MLITVNSKILNFFFLTQYFIPKSSKFENSAKNDSPSGACSTPGGTIYLSEILILVISISYLLVKTAKWFFDGKKLIQKLKVLPQFGK